MSFLFGGSKSKSSSNNQAFPWLQNILGSGVQTGANALNTLGGALSGGFDAFKKNSGFDYALNTGQRNISGSAAARGLLNSGSTGKALAGYESNLGNQTYQNYLGQLGNVAQLGNQGAGVIAGAGQQSTGSGSSTGGLLPALFG